MTPGRTTLQTTNEGQSARKGSLTAADRDAALAGDQRADARMAAHIRKVCIVESIEVTTHSRGGRAWRKQRRIAIRPVKTDITYAIALHEIGHILGPRQSGARLDKEVGAWEWARANAVVWTDAMQRQMEKRLCSYLRWADRSKQAKRPAPDHPIFAMVPVCAITSTGAA
jgi:hypothetical protein